MVKIDLPYIDHFRDRHGHIRYYFRRPMGPRIPLPSPDSPEFLAAYQAAAGKPKTAPRPQERTLDALMKSYFASPEFRGTRASTQAKYQGACNWLSLRYGPLPVAGMGRADVIKMRQRKAKDGASAANTMLKVLRLLVRHALDLEWITADPTLKIKKLKEGTHHTWTDDQIATFEARWPVGSRERLAFSLALYTGQRRADVAAMTWADVDRAGGTIRVVQEKTGTKLTIPIHPTLRALLAGMDRASIAIVASKTGGRMTTESLGNWMADAIGEAGLPRECVLHGLRKAAARRLAEAGCSAKEIAAITGHRTLGEIERYTADADQQKLAQSGIKRLK